MLRQSFEAKHAAAERQLQQQTQRLEESERKAALARTELTVRLRPYPASALGRSSQRLCSRQAELAQKERAVGTLREAVKLEHREAERSKRGEANEQGRGRQATKRVAEYRAEADELRRELADAETARYVPPPCSRPLISSRQTCPVRP